jgi:translocation and assembly module TamB
MGKINQTHTINGRLQLPITLTENTPFTSHFHLDVPNVKDLPNYIPYTEVMHGKLHADMAINGTLKNPIVKLTTFIQGGALHINALNLNINHIELQGTNHGLKTMIFNGHFLSEKNIGKINGTLNLTKAGIDLIADLSGEELLISNLKNYKIYASPKVQMHYDGHRLNLTGNVIVPKATITPPHKETITELSNDIIYVQGQHLETNFYNLFSTTLNIRFSNPATVHYENLQARVLGNLTLMKKINGPFTASGSLYTENGHYTAFGNSLDMTEGRLLYTGNLLANPGVSIKASKTIQVIATSENNTLIESDNLKPTYLGGNETTIGVIVHGTLSHPITSFYSEPAGMSQDDILSYLLFGYPKANISNTSSLMLLSHTLSSAKSGANVATITQKLQKNFGLSQLGVNSIQYYNPDTFAAENTTAVTVGKTLGSHFLLQYSVGLFKPISVLTARLKLTRNLSLQAEQNSLENGIDLLYEFEQQ